MEEQYSPVDIAEQERQTGQLLDHISDGVMNSRNTWLHCMTKAADTQDPQEKRFYLLGRRYAALTLADSARLFIETERCRYPWIIRTLSFPRHLGLGILSRIVDMDVKDTNEKLRNLAPDDPSP
jgi:hypothetical protein